MLEAMARTWEVSDPVRGQMLEAMARMWEVSDPVRGQMLVAISAGFRNLASDP